MFDHSVFANETLATDFTGEGFFAGMEAHVPSQIRFVIELLRAHFTLVRLVSSMFGKMLLKSQKIKISHLEILVSSFFIYLLKLPR